MRELADRNRVLDFMREFGKAARSRVRVYLVGGACAVLLGWRPATLDVDLTMEPEDDAAYRAIAEIKERLRVNVELAAPSHFIPEVPGWRERCVYVGSEGNAVFYHYDFYAQALSKIERGHAQDLEDVRSMVADELINPADLVRHFEEIEEMLYRYPALNRDPFRRAVMDFAASTANPPAPQA